MAQFWQRQKIYAQVTALGLLGGRWRSHHVRPRLRQIAPRNYAKQFRALQAEGVVAVSRWRSPAAVHTSGAPMADCARPAESACPVVVAYRWQTPPEGHRPTGAATGFGGAR